MTNLSQRIMDAWLAVNPEPKKHQWHIDFRKLRDMLNLEAYESAVIQFLVPEGWEWELQNYGFAIVFNSQGQEVHGGAPTPAEALLNAILVAREA